MAFDLTGIVSAKEMYEQQRILVYGVQGIGKTTFGCSFCKPILLRVESGAANINVATFPEVVSDYQDVVDAINALHDDHPFTTLVVDSLDWLEPILWQRTLDRLNGLRDSPYHSIEEVGYGKGYLEADKEWRNLFSGFDSLVINRGMQIVLIAHSEIKTFTPPDSDPYDRYQIKLHKRAFGWCQEWCDNVLFVNYQKTVQKVKDGGPKGESKFRGRGSGQRIIITEERPSHYAKNRWHLPYEISIGTDATWAGFHNAMFQATEGKYPMPEGMNNGGGE